MRWLENQMMQEIRLLSETIGGRGSCTDNERRAAEYTVERLRALGAAAVQVEPFQAVPSTYWPYSLSFALALTGSLTFLIFGGKPSLILSVLFNALGFWGMLAEAEFASSWTRWFLPRAQSQNVCARIPTTKSKTAKVVLCAHLDSHRTPLFYSSTLWQKAFSLLVGIALISMAVGAITSGMGLLLGWVWIRWLSLALVLIQGFALALCLHADFTPFSPGANDNASGVAVVLGVVQNLRSSPLANTEVQLVFTGCEEVGDWGMRAFLDAHADQLGKNAFFITIDQVGAGQIKVLVSDGLIFKHRTHPYALKIARETAVRRPDLEISEGVGVAYTDALMATKRGYVALTLCAVPRNGAVSGTNWHQMSDTAARIIPADLQKTVDFTWELLRTLDIANGR